MVPLIIDQKNMIALSFSLNPSNSNDDDDDDDDDDEDTGIGSINPHIIDIDIRQPWY